MLLCLGGTFNMSEQQEKTGRVKGGKHKRGWSSKEAPRITGNFHFLLARHWWRWS